MELSDRWTNLLLKYTDDQQLIQSLWKEIELAYGQKNRAYHNLSHLNNMFLEMDQFLIKIEDKDILQFSIWYLDIVYHATRKDNEVKSAERAQAVLEQLCLKPDKVNRCYQQIVMTKAHQVEGDTRMDEKYLLDFDLEVLSLDWSRYKTYCVQIREEYKIYPGILYRKGRKAALAHFLDRAFIYQTDYYRREKEATARKNIEREIKELL